MPIDAVVLFFAVTPAIRIVVSHDVKLSQELWPRRVVGRVGCNMVATGGDQTSWILGMDDFELFGQSLRGLGIVLVADFVAGAPQYD